MSFRIRGLDPAPFVPLYGRTEADLAAAGVIRCTASTSPGFPDRIELRDAEVGETLLLLNFTHQTAPTPYRASHAIYVREGADAAFDAVDVVPDVLKRRLLSVRAFDAAGLMVDADVVAGDALAAAIPRFLDAPATAYLHVHNAKRGCYAALVERA